MRVNFDSSFATHSAPAAIAKEITSSCFSEAPELEGKRYTSKKPIFILKTESALAAF